MDTIGNIIILWSIVCGIMYGILIWKIWRMTDDVHELKKQFCDQKSSHSSDEETQSKSFATGNLNSAPDPTIPKDYDERLDSLKPGDMLRRKSDGKEMKVESVAFEQIMCSTGMFGSSWYKKSDLEVID